MVIDIPLADLHCDTALEMYQRNQSFSENALHISAQLSHHFSPYTQVTAIYCPQKLTDEQGWNQFPSVLSHLKSHTDGVASVLERSQSYAEESRRHLTLLIPAVEDARILSGKPERLAVLRDAGIRIITLLWGGETCIGGSHDTEAGLTAFGKEAVRLCAEYGIVPDVSHASERSTEEIIEISARCNIPCIASHSNSYSVFHHSRNLRDRHFKAIRDLGGIVGINLCPAHLGSKNYETVLSHTEHYLELGGEGTVALGCDFDGTDLPDGIRNLADLERIAELFARHGYSDRLIRRIYYENANQFLIQHLNGRPTI